MRAYSVQSTIIEDTGRGLLETRGPELHGLTQAAAEQEADRLSRDDDASVYVTWADADGVTGYLNRDGHSPTGRKW